MQLLERAVTEIRQLPDEQQNEIAERLLYELEDAHIANPLEITQEFLSYRHPDRYNW
jgi:hypothetical protein